MNFEIITGENYTIIMPMTAHIDKALCTRLNEEILLLRDDGRLDVIIDLQHCTIADKEVLQDIADMHETSYASGNSLVFTNIATKIWDLLKETETDLLINVAPSMEEAIDIIKLETLERDILNEE